MNKLSLFAGAFALTVGVGSPVLAQSGHKLLKGTAIGAGGGALVGAVVPGISTGTGALIGAGTGAAVTIANSHHRRYRDARGRRYYVNKHGRRVYN